MFKIDHFHTSKTDPSMLRNMAGPIFDLCLDQCLVFEFGQFLVIFSCFDFAETTTCIEFSAQICMFKPPLKNYEHSLSTQLR